MIQQSKMGQIPNLVKVLGIHEDCHLGTSEEGKILNLKTHGRQLKEKGPLWAVAGQIGKVSKVGFNLNSPITLITRLQ